VRYMIEHAPRASVDRFFFFFSVKKLNVTGFMGLQYLKIIFAVIG
jgi:hypothetical protein